MPLVLALLLTLTAAPNGEQRARARLVHSRGQLAYAQGDLNRAKASFARATTLDPAFIEPWYWLGITCERLGDLPGAEKALLRAVESGGEPTGPVLKLLGSVQVRLKKFTWAMRSLSGARELLPLDRDVMLLLAYCLVHMEEYEDAAKLLSVVLKKGDADQRARARVLLGILNYRTKKLARARMLIARGDRFPGLRDRLLSLIMRKELGLRRGYGGTVSLSLGFDSNPALNADPDRSLVSTGDGGFATTLTGYMWYQPTEAISGELSLLRTFYASPFDSATHDRIASFNLTALEAGVTYRHRYLSGSGHHRRLEAGYLFSLTALDGGAGIPSEPDLFFFSEKHSLILTYHRAPSADQSMDLTLTPSYTAFRDKDRDALDLKGSLRWSLFYWNNRFKIFPTVFGGTKKAAWDPWSSWYGGLWLGFSTLGPKKTDITGYVSWQAEYFPSSGTSATGYSTPLWGLTGDDPRQDHLMGAGISLSRAFWGGTLRAGVTARYTASHSNARYFDYDRWALLFSLSGKLDRERKTP